MRFQLDRCDHVQPHLACPLSAARTPLWVSLQMLAERDGHSQLIAQVVSQLQQLDVQETDR